MSSLFGVGAAGNTETSGIMPGKGLANPAFKIKIVSPTDKLEQPKSPGAPTQVDDYTDKLRVGDRVEFTLDGEKKAGRVESVIKNPEGDGIFVEVIDDNGKSHKVEGSRITSSHGPSDDAEDTATSSTVIFTEKKFLSYEEFNNV